MEQQTILKPLTLSKKYNKEELVNTLILFANDAQKKGGFKTLVLASNVNKVIKYLKKVNGYESIVSNEESALNILLKSLEEAQNNGALTLEEAETITLVVGSLNELRQEESSDSKNKLKE